MGGLLVLFLLWVYCWIGSTLMKRTQSIWGKVSLILALILIPSVDAVYGRYQLKQMCKKEGGLHIYQTRNEIEGFTDDNPPDKWWIETYGYKFVEGPRSGGSYDRLSKNSEGNFTLEKNIIPQSKYQVQSKYGNSQDIYMIFETTLFNKDTSEVLGRIVNFGYAGGFIERFIASIYASRGSGGDCNLGYPEKLHEQLVSSILKSAKN